MAEVLNRQLFEVAQKVINEFGRSGHEITDDQAFELYAFFKQATIGDIKVEKSDKLDSLGIAKWEAWNGKKGITQLQAREQYVITARSVLPPEWSSRIA